MKEFKGTPGEWAVLAEEVDRPYVRIRGTRFGSRYKIANVMTPVHEGISELEAEETRANAKLIAAAPELLSALQEMVAIVKKHTHPQPDKPASTWGRMEAAEAVIAKALGESL